MVFRKVGKDYIVRLVIGEKLVEALTKFAKENDVQSGWVSGLGGATEVELGSYSVGNKQYSWKTFTGDIEIAAAQGNISLVGGAPFLHLHGTIGDHEFQSFSGHIKEAVVAGTVEFFVQPFDEPIIRKHDDHVGLKLLNL